MSVTELPISLYLTSPKNDSQGFGISAEGLVVVHSVFQHPCVSEDQWTMRGELV